MKKAAELENRIENDKSLVVKIISGTSSEKESAFAELYKKYKPSITQKMNIGVKFDLELAKDLTMEVFIKAHLNMEKYNAEGASFSTWLHTIAINHLRDHKRKDKNNLISINELDIKNEEGTSNLTFQIIDDSINNNGFDVMNSTERSNTLHKAVDSIKNNVVRDVVKLRFFEDISYDEISKKMNIPLGSAKAYVNRGKEEIKNFLEKNKFEFAK